MADLDEGPSLRDLDDRPLVVHQRPVAVEPVDGRARVAADVHFDVDRLGELERDRLLQNAVVRDLGR